MALASKTANLVALANAAVKKLTFDIGFNHALRHIRVVSFSEDVTRMTAEMKLTKEHLNKLGTLHGGCATTIIDELTFLNYALHRGHLRKEHSLSVRLEVNFMTTAKEGDLIEINSQLVKVGKRLAFVSAEITNKSKDNKVVAIGQQIISIDPKAMSTVTSSEENAPMTAKL